MHHKIFYKNKIIIAYFLFVFVFSNRLLSKPQNADIILYNISFGSIVGTLGAIINKKKHQKWYWAFLKGFLQGSAGGLVSYFGKKMAYQINEKQDLAYAWPAKLIQATGASIIENAANNKYFWETWSTHIGFIRLELQPIPFKIRGKWLPFASLSFLNAATHADLNIKNTFLTGTPYFEKNKPIFGYDGFSFSNDAIINTNALNIKGTFGHELIHTFQFRDYLAFNAFLNPIDDIFRSKYKLYNMLANYIYLDIPYFGLAKAIGGQYQRQCKYKNYFEMEATVLSQNKSVFIPNDC